MVARLRVRFAVDLPGLGHAGVQHPPGLVGALHVAQHQAARRRRRDQVRPQFLGSRARAPERGLRLGELRGGLVQAAELVERAAEVVVDAAVLAGRVVEGLLQAEGQRLLEGLARRLELARLHLDQREVVPDLGVVAPRRALETRRHLAGAAAVGERRLDVAAARLDPGQVLQALEQLAIGLGPHRLSHGQRVLQQALGHGVLAQAHVGAAHRRQQAGPHRRCVLQLGADAGGALVEHLPRGHDPATGLIGIGDLEQADEELGHLVGGARVERRPRLGLAGAVALVRDDVALPRQHARTSRPAAPRRPTPRRPTTRCRRTKRRVR